MSGTTISEPTAEVPAGPWRMAGNAALGAVFGALGGGVVPLFEYVVRARNLRDIALTTFLVIYPLVGAILGWLYSRSPHPKEWGWKRPPGFFAEGPLPPEELAARLARTARSMWIGFGSGIAIGLASSALDFAWRGWPYLSESWMSSLFFFPYFGACVGLNMGLRPGDPKPSPRNICLRVKSLMILTAYAAFCFWLVASTSRLSGAARHYLVKSQGARTTLPVFEKLLDDAVKDVGRRKNAEELREGRIPDGLLASQKDFLRSLDGTATEEYRKQRYGLIADGEERQADLAAGNVEIFSQTVEHFRKLADKYEKAAREPWLPVEPDPPMPGGTPGFPPPSPAPSASPAPG